MSGLSARRDLGHTFYAVKNLLHRPHPAAFDRRRGANYLEGKTTGQARKRGTRDERIAMATPKARKPGAREIEAARNAALLGSVLGVVGSILDVMNPRQLKRASVLPTRAPATATIADANAHPDPATCIVKSAP